jgi:hypothetical protein
LREVRAAVWKNLRSAPPPTFHSVEGQRGGPGVHNHGL